MSAIPIWMPWPFVCSSSSHKQIVSLEMDSISLSNWFSVFNQLIQWLNVCIMKEDINLVFWRWFHQDHRQKMLSVVCKTVDSPAGWGSASSPAKGAFHRILDWLSNYSVVWVLPIPTQIQTNPQQAGHHQKVTFHTWHQLKCCRVSHQERCISCWMTFYVAGPLRVTYSMQFTTMRMPCMYYNWRKNYDFCTNC